MRKLGNILIAGSLLFFLETAFEMYALTFMQGQQMLFFSLIHIAPGFFGLVVASGLIYLCLAMFALSVVVMDLAGKLDVAKGYVKLMLVILIVQVIHTSLFLTYDSWAAALFPSGGS